MLPEKPNYSLAEAAERIQCKPIDLLHYGVQKLITLYVGVPNRVDLRIYDEWTKQAFAPFLGQPQLLALEQSHCLNIETYGKTEQCDFPEGCSIESTGRLRTVRTSEGRPALNVRWVYWRTYRDGLIYPLLILPEHLFVLHPDLVKLMELAATKEGLRKTKSPAHKAVKQEIKERNGEFASPEAKTDDRPDSNTPAKTDQKAPTATEAEDEKSLKRQATIAFNTPARSATILRIEQVVTQTGLSKFNIYDRLNENSPRYDPTFPKQVALGSEAVGWYADEITAWVLSLRDKKFRWLGNWDSAMTPGNSSALNRYYYSLSEATKALKARGKSLSVYDLLHYGVQGTVRFFIHLPSGIRARQILESPACENDPQPNLLILSPLQCVEIECNKHTECSDFPSAYTSLYSYAENPPYPQNIESLEQKYWQTIDSNDAIKQIPITPKTIYLAHTEITYLFQQLDSPYRPPIEFIPQFDEQLQQEIKLRCYSFEDALKIAKEKIDGFTEIDLLRYGYFEKLTFLTPSPNNLYIAVVCVTPEGPPSFNGFTRKPDMLVLDPDDCYQIEIFGKAERSVYKTGFLFKFIQFTLKTFIPYPPSYHQDSISEKVGQTHSLFENNFRLRVKNTESSLRWQTYRNLNVFPLCIQKDDIYVLRSEFDPFINAALKNRDTEERKFEYTPTFTISDITRYHLSPKNFATLSEAAKIAKCSEIDILNEAAANVCISNVTEHPSESPVGTDVQQFNADNTDEKVSKWLCELLIPVPIEIALCQALDNLRKPKITYTSFPEKVEEVPQLLVLDETDCKALADSGFHKQGSFKLGYSFENNELVPRVPNYLTGIMDSNQEEIQEGSSTPSTTNNHKNSTCVWLTFYQDKPIEIEITFDQIFIELETLYFYMTRAENEKRIDRNLTAEIAAEFYKLRKLGDANASENSNVEQSNKNQPLESANPLSTDAPVEIVTKKQLADLAGISITTINNKTKRGGKYEDPDFPKMHKNEKNGRVHFLKSEVDAWIRKNPPRNRKQNPP